MCHRVALIINAEELHPNDEFISNGNKVERVTIVRATDPIDSEVIVDVRGGAFTALTTRHYELGTKVEITDYRCDDPMTCNGKVY